MPEFCLSHSNASVSACSSLSLPGGASYSRPLHLISSVYRRVQHVSRFSFWINAAAVWFLFLNASTSNDILSAPLARTKKAKLFKSPKKILLFLRIFVGPYNIKSIIVTMHMLEEIWFVFCVIAIKVNTLQGTFFFIFFSSCCVSSADCFGKLLDQFLSAD